MFRTRTLRRSALRKPGTVAAQVAGMMCESLETRRVLSGNAVCPDAGADCCPGENTVTIDADAVSDTQTDSIILTFEPETQDPITQFQVPVIDLPIETDSDAEFLSYLSKLQFSDSDRPTADPDTGTGFIANDDRDPGVFLSSGDPVDIIDFGDVGTATAQEENRTLGCCSTQQQQPIFVDTTVYDAEGNPVQTITITIPPTIPDDEPQDFVPDRLLEDDRQTEIEIGTDEDIDSALTDLVGSLLTGQQTQPRLQGDSIRQIAVVLPEAGGSSQSESQSLIPFPVGVIDGVRELLSNIINDETWLQSADEGAESADVLG